MAVLEATNVPEPDVPQLTAEQAKAIRAATGVQVEGLTVVAFVEKFGKMYAWMRDQDDVLHLKRA